MANAQIQTNIENYHSVFARTIETIYGAIIDQKNEEAAKKVVILNIEYAKGLLHQRFNPDELKEWQKKPIEELMNLMAQIQDEAGLTAVQKKSQTSFLMRLQKKEEEERRRIEEEKSKKPSMQPITTKDDFKV